MKSCWFFLTIACFVSIFAWAGDISDDLKKLSPRLSVKMADRLYSESSYYSAAEFYQQAITKNKKPSFKYKRYSYFWLAMSLYHSRDYSRAVNAFSDFYNLKPGVKDKIKNWELEESLYFEKGHYYYAQALQKISNMKRLYLRLKNLKPAINLKIRMTSC